MMGLLGHTLAFVLWARDHFPPGVSVRGHIKHAIHDDTLEIANTYQTHHLLRSIM